MKLPVVSCTNKLELIKIGMYNNSFKMREGHELRIRFEKIHKIHILNKFPLQL